MKMKRCNFCGESRFAERRVSYLYTRNGKYLLASNTPAEVCENCGMEFYSADTVREIERRFAAIHARTESPDEVLQIPLKSFA